MAQQSLIQLVIAWTLVGAFIFTVIVTCASLIGLLKFSDTAQQRKMFYVLIVQLTGICITYFGNILNYSTAVAASDAVKLSNYEYWSSFRHAGVTEIVKPDKFPDEYRYALDGVEGKIKFYKDLNVYVETNKLDNFPAYHYYFRPIKTDGDYIVVYDDSRAFALKLPVKSGMSYLSGNGGDGEYSEFRPLIVL